MFREAQGEAVLCCDSHVLFAPGAIRRLKEYYREHPDCPDLLQGPLVYDDLETISTHLDPSGGPRCGGFGQTDPRGQDPEGEPFGDTHARPGGLQLQEGRLARLQPDVSGLWVGRRLHP